MRAAEEGEAANASDAVAAECAGCCVVAVLCSIRGGSVVCTILMANLAAAANVSLSDTGVVGVGLSRDCALGGSIMGVLDFFTGVFMPAFELELGWWADTGATGRKARSRAAPTVAPGSRWKPSG